MVLAMSRPWKHPKTGIYYFRKGVPEHLRAAIGKREVKISLGTRVADEARELHASIAAQVARDWAHLQSPHNPASTSSPPERTLTDQQIVGLSGDLYREVMERHGESPGIPSVWEEKLRRLQLALPVRLRSEDFTPALKPSWSSGPALMAGRLLAEEVRDFTERHTLNLEWRCRNRFYIAAAMAMAQAYRELIKRAQGDFRPDPNESRFPPSPLKQEQEATDWRSLYQEYQGIAHPAAATVKRQLGVLTRFFAFLGHDAPQRVSEEDVRRWIRHRLTEADVSPRTVRDADFAHPKTLFIWAVGEKKLSKNPFAGIKIRVPKAVKLRDREYTHDEAERVLEASLVPASKRMTEEGAAARRWIPWLCAYTGARVNEITQLRASDVLTEKVPDGRLIWVINITPEAGTTKNKEARKVSLHLDLIDQGFLRYVASRKGKHLFYLPERGRGGKPAHPQYKKVGERLANWIRKDVGITDLGIDPNHAWRHLFRSSLLAGKVQGQVIDRIDGHTSQTVGERYGSAWPAVMLNAVMTIPPYLPEKLERPGRPRTDQPKSSAT